MIYEVYIPLWAHIVIPLGLGLVATYASLRVIWSLYRDHVNRQIVARRIAAIREGRA